MASSKRNWVSARDAAGSRRARPDLQRRRARVATTTTAAAHRKLSRSRSAAALAWGHGRARRAAASSKYGDPVTYMRSGRSGGGTPRDLYRAARDLRGRRTRILCARQRTPSMIPQVWSARGRHPDLAAARTAMIGLGFWRPWTKETLRRLRRDERRAPEPRVGRRQTSPPELGIASVGKRTNRRSPSRPSPRSATTSGITSELFPDKSCGPTQADCLDAPMSLTTPNIQDPKASAMVVHALGLAVPARRNLGDAQALHGEELFGQIGCGSCHIQKMVTGVLADWPELSNQTIHPYTDLLLHDMGSELAGAGRPDFKRPAADTPHPSTVGPRRYLSASSVATCSCCTTAARAISPGDPQWHEGQSTGRARIRSATYRRRARRPGRVPPVTSAHRPVAADARRLESGGEIGGPVRCYALSRLGSARRTDHMSQETS